MNDETRKELVEELAEALYVYDASKDSYRIPSVPWDAQAGPRMDETRREFRMQATACLPIIDRLLTTSPAVTVSEDAIEAVAALAKRWFGRDDPGFDIEYTDFARAALEAAAPQPNDDIEIWLGNAYNKGYRDGRAAIEDAVNKVKEQEGDKA